jgi:hypothetical protein
VISSAGAVESEGRRERTDQVGLERRAAMSSGSFCSFCEELYARVIGMGFRCWARSACLRDSRQRRHIDLDMFNL